MPEIEYTEKIAYQPNFDAEDENKIEKKADWIMDNLYAFQNYKPPLIATDNKAITGLFEGKVYIIHPEFVAMIKGTLSTMVRLLLRYNQNHDMQDEYLNEIKAINALPLVNTIARFEKIKNDFAYKMGVKAGFRNLTRERVPWKKKTLDRLQMPPLTEAGELYYDELQHNWQKIDFLITNHMVANDGDAHIFFTGVNDSGKTNTALKMLSDIGHHLRTFWAKTDWVKKYPTLKDLRKFNLREDVYYIPKTENLDDLLAPVDFNIKDFNEGLFAAVNLRSMSPDVIDMGAIMFATRSHHNAIAYEYQVAKRPPPFIMERFNVWIHKPNKKKGILFIPSSTYRKTDPLFLKKLDKAESDEQIDRFLYRSPIYITTFNTPRLSKQKYDFFKIQQANAHTELKKNRQIKRQLSETYYVFIEKIWNKVNRENTMVKMNIPTVLREQLHFDDYQIKSFMRKYDEYDQLQKLLGSDKKLETEVEV